MKKTILTIMTCLLVLTQCKKNIDQFGNNTSTGETVDVSVEASSDDDKAVIDGYSVSWVANDRLYVVGQLDGYLGYLTTQSSGSAVKFKGTIKKTTAAQNYYFYYVGGNDFALSGDDVLTFSVANQYGILSGNANSIANKFMLLKGSLYLSGTPGGELGHVTLNSMLSIARLNFKLNGASMSSGTVTVYGGYSSVKINTKTGGYVSPSPLTSGNITLNNASGSYYMAIIPGNQTSSGTSQTLTFSTDIYGVSVTAAIVANKFYNKDSAKLMNMVHIVETDDWVNYNDLPGESFGVSDVPIWSKKNLGATNGTTPESWYGDYYAWGEILPYYADGHAYDATCSNWRVMTTGAGNTDITHGYAWETYSQGATSSFTEWTNHPYDSDNMLDDAHDAARRNVPGGEWHMPNNEELRKLMHSVYNVIKLNYRGIGGLNGIIMYKVKNASDKGLFTDENGKTKSLVSGDFVDPVAEYQESDPHIFMPAAGIRNGVSFYYDGVLGTFLSRNLMSGSLPIYSHFYIGDDDPSGGAYFYRSYGFSVRPVRDIVAK